MSYASTEVLDLEAFATSIVQDDMYDTYQTFRTVQRSRNEYENLNYEDEDDQVLDLYGEVEELATIELSVHPATVRIDNDNFDGETRVIIEGANRLGTLVEVGCSHHRCEQHSAACQCAALLGPIRVILILEFNVFSTQRIVRVSQEKQVAH
jgi:hypothetical protein